MKYRRLGKAGMQVSAVRGIGITVFSPLAQGMLTGKYNDGIPT